MTMLTATAAARAVSATKIHGTTYARNDAGKRLRSMVRLESVIVPLFGTVGGLGLGVYLGWAWPRRAARPKGSPPSVPRLPGYPVTRLVVILVLGAVAGVIAAIRPARSAAGLPLLRAIATE